MFGLNEDFGLRAIKLTSSPVHTTLSSDIIEVEIWAEFQLILDGFLFKVKSVI
jgi:hypothetical protein